jgi:hypothetical protein
MSSEVKANKLSPATGTDVTLGDASDTFTLPASATIQVWREFYIYLILPAQPM